MFSAISYCLRTNDRTANHATHVNLYAHRSAAKQDGRLRGQRSSLILPPCHQLLHRPSAANALTVSVSKLRVTSILGIIETLVPFRTILVVAVLNNYAYAYAISVAGIEATVIARIVDAGFAIALTLKAGKTAAGRGLRAVANVGVLVGHAQRSTILTERAGVPRIV